ncbi:MAG TPA: hypothetical protein PKE26_07665, partial [Kiritimatiellia bacterium]|nr:hypothetical protein [Kiritimatiellia bacterium]HMO98969.1 hypothetical protein [Kiritimatiellia bacterium]HMP96680.1 hypothetical protein [Kiritimatiellia bacterium]
SFITVMVIAVVAAVTMGHRSLRLYQHATDLQQQIKYMVETGESIGTAPAESALSATYLEIIFGEDPELLEQLKLAVERGMREMPDVQRGEVSAIIVTYRKNGDDKIENVIAHIMGEFPLGRRQITMHEDGFFASQIDNRLWETGDAAIRFLGRDMIVWGNTEDDERAQRELIEAVFSGEIIIVADSIVQKPLYYTAVLPAPRQVVPLKLRPHVRAILFNGFLSAERGSLETVILTDSERASARVSSIVYDLKLSAQLALRTRFRGVMEETPWNPNHIPVWWSYEMANTLEDTQLVRRDRTVRLNAEYERRMVNAFLKSMERFGRDYSQIRGTQEEKLDPRIVDARMRTRKPNHYWSEAHKWGPDWPIPASGEIVIQRPDDPSSPLLDDAPPVTQSL